MKEKSHPANLSWKIPIGVGAAALTWGLLLTQRMPLFDEDYPRWIDRVPDITLSVIGQELVTPLPASGALGFLDKPVMSAIFKMIEPFAGYNPVPYHLMKVVFLVACVILLTRLVQVFTRDRTLAVLAGLLFAVSPTLFEATLVVADFEVLAQILAIATLFTFGIDLRDGGRGSLWLVVVGGLCGWLAIKTKLSGKLLPAVMALGWGLAWFALKDREGAIRVVKRWAAAWVFLILYAYPWILQPATFRKLPFIPGASSVPAAGYFWQPASFETLLALLGSLSLLFTPCLLTLGLVLWFRFRTKGSGVNRPDESSQGSYRSPPGTGGVTGELQREEQSSLEMTTRGVRVLACLSLPWLVLHIASFSIYPLLPDVWRSRNLAGASIPATLVLLLAGARLASRGRMLRFLVISAFALQITAEAWGSVLVREVAGGHMVRVDRTNAYMTEHLRNSRILAIQVDSIQVYRKNTSGNRIVNPQPVQALDPKRRDYILVAGFDRAPIQGQAFELIKVFRGETGAAIESIFFIVPDLSYADAFYLYRVVEPIRFQVFAPPP